MQYQFKINLMGGSAGVDGILLDMKLGIYRHSKTRNLYRVIALGKHSETLEDMVVYECLYENPTSKIWVRPLKSFLKKVVINGKKLPRFEFVK